MTGPFFAPLFVKLFNFFPPHISFSKSLIDPQILVLSGTVFPRPISFSSDYLNMVFSEPKHTTLAGNLRKATGTGSHKGSTRVHFTTCL